MGRRVVPLKATHTLYKTARARKVAGGRDLGGNLRKEAGLNGSSPMARFELAGQLPMKFWARPPTNKARGASCAGSPARRGVYRRLD
jgi:hypothetical protein